MVEPATPPANGFVRLARKAYNPLGFQKGYNFVLWFIFAGALWGFGLARTMYFNIPGVFCGPNNGSNHAAPGECYYYDDFEVYRIGIRLHLFTIIPAALLVGFQFVPAIRHKVILVHRINGYLIIVLATVANVGALMIARHAFGGTLDTQLLVGVLVILTTLGLANAIYNIKRLQIDQHRAWMLRTWFYFSTIVTLRIIMIIAAQIITSIGDYSMVQPCAKLSQIFNDNNRALTHFYPACADLTANVIVNANFNGNPAEVGTTLNMCFGMSGWLALTMHAIGVEIYLHLTPRESQRLRDVSYQRQLEANYKNPGNGGFTVQKLGDANPYVPPSMRKEKEMPRNDSDTTIMGEQQFRGVKEPVSP